MANYTKEQQIINAIKIHASEMDVHMAAVKANAKYILVLLDSLTTHTKNRIAAHKAHVTMAKRALNPREKGRLEKAHSKGGLSRKGAKLAKGKTA